MALSFLNLMFPALKFLFPFTNFTFTIVKVS